ncbi:ABC transporter permease subunit [Gracilibacillus salitolerans]|uniref:ABC transporter permease subunit n=1 Tax=Gracilibacillus salitolerans TaxID=2663022 RepID=A0A5Q2TPN0_9BACI|nr:sugar ABC transporter permease [Gracilibacillus salitolerans]QGH36121.1 ABC transporter permease subunit [Gracilibacillus salitolerans]
MNRKRRTGFIVFCILPTLLLFSLFVIYPTIQVFSKSMYNWSGLGDGMTFVGLENFMDVLNDGVFLTSLKNTAFLMMVVPFITLFSALVLASILSKGNLREKSLYRVVFFFPSILSFVIIGILWSFIYHPTMGVVNSVLEFIGLENMQRAWLGDKDTVMWVIAFTMVWQAVGYYMVMYLAGMDNIPEELYEAASIDGATAIQQFFKITIPMVWEIVRITIIFSINGVLVISFILVQVMTSGGPSDSSQVVLHYMFQQAFRNANFGYAMAIAVFVFVISIGLSMLSNKLSEREN